MLSAGTCVEWLRDDLGIIDTAADSAEVAARCEDTGDVWFVPALLGLGTPVWDFGARGTFVGLTRGSGRPELVRAVLEGVAHRGADLLEAAEADSGLRVAAAPGRRGHVGQPGLRPGPGRRLRPPRRDRPRCSRPPPWAPPTWPAWPSGTWADEDDVAGGLGARGRVVEPGGTEAERTGRRAPVARGPGAGPRPPCPELSALDF